jgi:hypothetical protein
VTAAAARSESPGTRRREFVRAFVEHAWARPGTERPVARVHVAMMVTMATMVGAVLVGVALQLLKPVKLAQAVPVAVATGTRPSYTAVSGWDCATAADHGFDVDGRTAAWNTVARGGWGGDGCHGTFETIPMSGKAGSFDQNQSATWWFSPGGAMTRCDVSVYLPAPEDPLDVAATAAKFFVLAGRSGGQFASFVLNQTAERGAWKQVGTFPTNQSGIALRLVNQGLPIPATARLAVTQVKVDCTG